MKTVAAFFALSILTLTSQAQMTVMPLGDSITYGAKRSNSGYRYGLYNNLTKAGIGIRFLGQSTRYSMPMPLDQAHHNGYPGATIADIQNDLMGNPKRTEMVVPNEGGYWMTGGNKDGNPVIPDVILLLIGTNDIIHHPKKCEAAEMQGPYKNLVDWFLKNRPNTQIILATLPPITRTPARQNDVVIAFNKWLMGEAPTWSPRCTVVDFYPLFLQADGSINRKLLPDGVHPDQEGYDLMADAWTKAILHLVSKGHLKKVSPVTISAATFALATGRQSTRPSLHGLRVKPDSFTNGAEITIPGTLSAGNRALSSTTVSVSLFRGKGKAKVRISLGTVKLTKIGPHQQQKFEVTGKIPQDASTGTYIVSAEAQAPEGSALLRFGPKIQITE